MSVIFIPSKKIYDVSHDKVADNIITRVELSYNNVTVNYGNILNREYTLNYWRRNSDNSAIEGVYNDVEQTEGFELTATGTLELGEVTATLRLPYDKLTKFDVDVSSVEVINLLSHKLKSVQRISVDEGVSFYEKTVFYTPTLKNLFTEGEKGIIELSFSRLISLAVGDKIHYILSETISIVGDYITTEQTSRKIGAGEKTFTISANSLMQDTNTNLEKFANDILANYGKGKETITARCSVGEYYDENGELVISTKTADKMTFEHYDRVVFMTRNAWGTDSPISLNANGNAKVFEVLGVRILADGAVWQELKAREVGEIAVGVQLATPIVRIVGDTLQITDISGKAEEFDVYVNGGLVATITESEYDLSALNLSNGTYSLRVVARASGYNQSAESEIVWYVVDEELYTTYYTEVNEANGLTYFITSNDYRAENGTYIIGEQS